MHCKLYLPNGWQTRITLHLANVKWITGLMAPRLSSLTLAVFGPNTCYNYNGLLKTASGREFSKSPLQTFFTLRGITNKLFAKLLLDRLFELFMFDLECCKLVFDWTLRKKYKCFNVVYISFPVLTNILNIYKKRV